MLKTTYFAKVKSLDPSLNFISIAHITVPNFPGRRMSPLAPTPDILWAVKNGGSVEDYTLAYNSQLSKLDPHEVVRDAGEDAVFVCYEGKDKFCHRHLLADWLRAAGYEVEEL